MGRRTRATSRSAKRRRSIARPKVRKSAAGIADIREQLAHRTLELDDALQQQIATSEILSIIRQSPADAQPVFDAIVQSASRLCGAMFGVVYLCDGDRLRIAATNHFTPAATIQLNELQQLKRPERSHLGGRAILDREIIHVPDVLEDPEYSREFALAGGWRAVLAVPLMRDGIPLGALTAAKAEPAPFSDRQIQLLKTFAEQAVIAIENTRLLNELRQRTDDLTEALEQQTATSEVLRVISSSPTNVQPVFDAIAESAVRLCDGQFSFVLRFDGKVMDFASCCGLSAEGLNAFHSILPMPASEATAGGRAVVRRAVVEIPDVEADPSYGAQGRGLAKAVNYRSIAAVPLLNEGNPIGAIAVARANAGSFPKRQIVLLQAFADQAVIAIKNVRLFDEVQASTRDLAESLQQQTATADVLKVISRSTFDLQTVLDTLVESAVRLCEAERGLVFRREGEIYKSVAYYNYLPEFRAFHERHPIAPGRGTAVGRTALEGKSVQIADVLTDPEYTFGEAQKLGGGRATLAVPLLREGTPIGALSLQRTEPRPYSRKQIELVETFADQAVIAIENVRLFDEVQTRTRDLADSLQQQTATADVLKTISRSTFDLPTVLDALIETAARMSDADQGAITREINGAFFRAASYGYSTAFADFIRNTPVQIDRGSTVGRALVEGRIVHIADVKVDADFTFSPALDSGDFRTALGVPMLREGVPIGVLSLTRKDVRPFTDKQIELVTTFADQATIAIENVRLFESVEARTRDLADSLEDLRNTQDRLVQTQKLASLGQLTAGIAHEIKNPLNFVNNFSAVSSELIDELQGTLKGPLNEKVRADVNELAETLRGNLDKIVQHGKRADAIVKNMLLHSREGSGEHRAVDINALVEESLNLAYHGARAEKQGFNITLQRSFDPLAGEVDLFPQDITRALLNFISNGFYAATKRGAETNGGNYEPTLVAATKNLGDRVEIAIRDNGTGIPLDVKERMFNPFFTTKPTGEGTGLGLSISHDIIVKQHGGSIEVDTQPGEFTEIRVILPRATTLLPGRS